MESIYNKIDNLIKNIDAEFIKLYDCAENSSEYEYFYFFSAIDQLIKILKQYSLFKYYNDKVKRIIIKSENQFHQIIQKIVELKPEGLEIDFGPFESEDK